MFAGLHAGGRVYECPLVNNRYRFEAAKVNFEGFAYAQTEFSAGPMMRYAILSDKAVNVFFGAKSIGRWSIPNAKIIGWWNLPVVTSKRNVYRLEFGKAIALPISADGLLSVLPTTSGGLCALYSNGRQWRVLHWSSADAVWSPWMSGKVADCTATLDGWLVACGGSYGGYREYGAQGPGALWSYSFESGRAKKIIAFGSRKTVVFDDPWVRSRHLISETHQPLETNEKRTWFPDRTTVYLIGETVLGRMVLPTGWEVHAYDPKNRRFLALHINRGEMGFDLCSVTPNGRSRVIDESIDALFMSTAAGYSPSVGRESYQHTKRQP
jgi:hypothetical protein